MNVNKIDIGDIVLTMSYCFIAFAGHEEGSSAHEFVVILRKYCIHNISVKEFHSYD